MHHGAASAKLVQCRIIAGFLCRTAIEWPDQWTATYEYDGLHRLETIRDDAGTVLQHFDYDRAGRLMRVWNGGVDAAGSVSDQALAYSKGRDLISVAHSFDGGTDFYANHGYDGSGKLTSECTDQPGWLSQPVSNKTDTYDLIDGSTDLEPLDQYAKVNGATLEYDGRGNMMEDNTGLLAGSAGYQMTYTHDSENRLLTASNTVWTVTHTYDPNGRRIYTDSTQYTDMKFVHAGDMEIAEYDGSTGDLLRRYIPGAGVDQRAGMLTYSNGSEADRHYYHTNRLGSVVALVSGFGTDIGQISDKYVYSPYGVEDVLNLSGNPFRYTGRKLDADSGLYYYRARYYSAELGRFLQTDPIGYEDQMNLYAYVHNDPLSYIDPFGLCGNTVGEDGHPGDCQDPLPDSDEGLNEADQPGEGGGDFDDRRGNGTHEANDILAEEGEQVVAAGAGRVVYVDDPDGAGTAMEIYHDDGSVTRYYHLQTRTVQNGARVEAGDQIGTVGRTGNVPEAADTHLHFEVLSAADGPAVDPQTRLRDGSRRGE